METRIRFINRVQPTPIGTNQVGAGVPAVASGFVRLELEGRQPDRLQYLKVKTPANQECIEVNDSRGEIRKGCVTGILVKLWSPMEGWWV